MKIKQQFAVNQILKPSEYNPLLDKYLSCYFQSKQVIKTLNRGRLINKKGEILDYGLQKQYIRYYHIYNHSFKCPKMFIEQKQQNNQIFFKYVYHSEFPFDKLPLLDIQGKLNIQKQKEKLKSQSVNLTSQQLSQHLNNTYLKKPEIIGKKKQYDF